MCCFSRPVKLVSDTNIFARKSKKGHQFLVYSMKLDTAGDVAMVLPLPVPKGTGEKGVRFIDLEGYPDLFADLRKGFPAPPTLGRGRGRPAEDAKARTLEVVSVGSFEASFVPEVADFARLDERFRLPEKAWDRLPRYRDWGFAVFKLKKGKRKIHPMAFEFPTRLEKLFFPTVHVHDGKVHDKARFDHSLFLQPGSADEAVGRGWEESPRLAETFVRTAKTKGIVRSERHCYRKRMHGSLENADVVV